MAALYLTPAILLATLGARRTTASTCIWILPLLGLILSGRGVLAVVAAGALAVAARSPGR